MKKQLFSLLFLGLLFSGSYLSAESAQEKFDEICKDGQKKAEEIIEDTEEATQEIANTIQNKPILLLYFFHIAYLM